MVKQFALDGGISFLPVLETLYKQFNFQTVLEVVENFEGCGDYSTKYFMSLPVNLVTIQTNPEYKSVNDNAVNITGSHQLEYMVQDPKLFDLVFIDTRIELSYFSVQSLLKNTSLIVMHDTQSSIYCVDKVVLTDDWYYADCIFHRPWTGVFSRYKEKLKELVSEIPGVLYDNMEHKIYIEQV